MRHAAVASSHGRADSSEMDEFGGFDEVFSSLRDGDESGECSHDLDRVLIMSRPPYLVENDLRLFAFAERLPSFVGLLDISIANCHMSASQLRIVCVGLAALPHFRSTSAAAARVDLSGNELDSKSFCWLCKHLRQPLHGVAELLVSRTRVDDDCFVPIANVFPNTVRLHLSGTQVACRDGSLSAFLRHMPQLHLLNVDGTAFEGPADLEYALRERLKSRLLCAEPLTVWLRGLCDGAFNARWHTLLSLCAHVSSNDLFYVRHDHACQQIEQTTRIKHAVQPCAAIEVRLSIPDENGERVLRVNLSGRVCSESARGMAESVVDELNAVVCLNRKHEMDKRGCTQERVRAYESIVAPDARDGLARSNVRAYIYEVDAVCCVRHNPHGDTDTVVRDVSELYAIGVVPAYERMSLHVKLRTRPIVAR